jgi:hypothetical protein
MSTMIDINTEHLLTLAQAARLRPAGRQGRPTHPSTVYRWISRGLRGHRLESIRLGGTLYTSREALQRFAEQLTLEQGGTTAFPAEADRQRAAHVADEALARLRF